jgi:hypothetical protein
MGTLFSKSKIANAEDRIAKWDYSYKRAKQNLNTPCDTPSAINKIRNIVSIRNNRVYDLRNDNRFSKYKPLSNPNYISTEDNLGNESCTIKWTDYADWVDWGAADALDTHGGDIDPVTGEWVNNINSTFTGKDFAYDRQEKRQFQRPAEPDSWAAADAAEQAAAAASYDTHPHECPYASDNH